MSLINDIQNDAVDSRSDLGSLLRKCKLLAARLDSRPLEDWLICESNGYPETIELPNYRVWPVSLKGHFSGAFGSGLRNASIPSMCVPETLHENFLTFRCHQSIASVEELLRRHESGSLQVSCGDLALALGGRVYERMNCVQVWGEFSVGHLTELLNAVRNKILDFAIALWKENPMAGDIRSDAKKTESERVNQIFNTTVYGGAANVLGNNTNSSITITVEQNNMESVRKALAVNRVDDESIAELEAALAAEPERPTPSTFGPRVAGWMSGMLTKAATGSWDVGVGTAGELLANIIGSYYGL